MPWRRRTRDDDRPRGVARCRTVTLISAGIVATLLTGACGGGDTPPPVALPQPSAVVPDEKGKPLPTAPQSARVDLAEPTFSNPTDITNPLFPVSDVAQAIQLGEEDGKSHRVEYTRLPDTKTIEVDGQQIETVVAHFIAYDDRRIVEFASDYYAQADDGSVWYLGESVANYEDGVIADREGTWLAGKDGPPAMIMPAHPRVGDVYRPENIPGRVFEEVAVKAVNDTYERGPRGPVDGVLRVRELHQDTPRYEPKAFAPGYGEFLAHAENLAVAAPTDALGRRLPDELETLSSGAAEIFDAAPSGGWRAIAAKLDSVTAAWRGFRQGHPPPLLDAQMTEALRALVEAVDARRPTHARQAALDVTRAALDLELQHRPVAEVDLARLDLWARQLLIDAAADEPSGVASNVAILETIWDRVGHAVDASDAERIDTQLGELSASADAKDLPAASGTAAALRVMLRGLRVAPD